MSETFPCCLLSPAQYESVQSLNLKCLSFDSCLIFSPRLFVLVSCFGFSFLLLLEPFLFALLLNIRRSVPLVTATVG